MKNRTLICNVCNGEMTPYTGPKYNRGVGGFLIVAGGFSTLFWVGPVLGLPLLIMGIYMTGAKRQLWVCQDCNAALERIELRPNTKVPGNRYSSQKQSANQKEETKVTGPSEG